MNLKTLSLLSILFLFNNISFSQTKLFPIQKGKVTIEGSIADYKKVYKTGKFSYFDGVSRLTKNEIFEIDTSGLFKISFDLMHAVYGTANFDLEGKHYFIFIQPGKTYKVSIENSKLIYKGGTGQVNTEITKLQQIIYDQFKDEIGRMMFLHKENLAIDEAVRIHKEFANKTIAFLKNYAKNNEVSNEALAVLENEFHYKTAQAWINYRYDYSDGGRKLIESLPEGFYMNIHNDFPVNVEGAIVSRNYIDYISNIATVLTSPKQSNVKAKIEFFRSFNTFSDKELELVEAVYQGEQDIRKSDEFKKFFSPKNSLLIDRLNRKFDVQNLLIAVRQFPEGIGRDLIISQFVSKKYFKNTFVIPSKGEWKTMEILINSSTIFEHLKELAQNLSVNNPEPTSEGASPAIKEKPTKKSVRQKYLAPYKGKVIYIDFWATWCGPCRKEEPHSRRLAEEFKKDDVIFLNLCCQSKENNWKQYVRQKDLHGENFLLSNEEFRLFAELYKVKGFPTFVLIDKDGKVKTTDAYWPSDYRRVVRQIDKLLKD